MATDYAQERAFFDRVASATTVTPMSRDVLERYAAPRHPHLFAKELMFRLAGDLRGKRVLEVGCGEGVASVQLAYCGAAVDAVDISPVSIDVARRRADTNAQDVTFRVADVTREDLADPGTYDVVWCDLILHHLTDSLGAVMDGVWRWLRPGGVFIAREPVAYAGWLKALRGLVPVAVDATDDEQPLRDAEFDVIRQRFPDLKRRYFRILARADRMGAGLPLLRGLARMDNALLTLPGTQGLAGNVVVWGTK
ncbi:class I SAM-dependent methyltransferase [Urbifossiella limnaea]|uniref:Ubiquinone biosynthesis O-methyltransferase n=1 Tax=Urbifossiella limnaea TaxID=2528023 RepID=A0A517XW02_9BACT|nr:class I SAM-dependent methyltransferase [Urbifossiella limnaea]QDU21679.1 Ubiquinone biosynthesis O-methyltransferase [Urbifossiella limnaea]